MAAGNTVFLDRDGVINADSPDYIKRWAEFHFIPGSLDAIARLTKAGLNVVIITNQSAVHRNLLALEELESIHRHLKQAVRDSGGRIADIFFCPHRPEEGCVCRKPKPGMILAARQRHGIALAGSVMVGDSATDILAGKAAGCGRTVLVETGNGRAAARSLAAADACPDHIAVDLDHAANWILADHPRA